MALKNTILILIAIGALLNYSSRQLHGPQSESGGVLPRFRLEAVQPHEGEFTNRLPPILKPHEAASDQGGVPLPPRGVHPAIELAGCTAGKAREGRAGLPPLDVRFGRVVKLSLFCVVGRPVPRK